MAFPGDGCAGAAPAPASPPSVGSVAAARRGLDGRGVRDIPSDVIPRQSDTDGEGRV